MIHRYAGAATRRPYVPIATLLALLLGLLAGCGRAPDNTPRAVVLVASATRNEPAPTLAPDNRNLLFSAGADSTEGDAYLVTADTGEPVELPLTPRRPDGQVEYGSRRGQLLSQNISRVQNALANEAASGPVDLLARIAVAARITSVPGTLLILSSGLSTTGAFDLRQVGWDANPAAIAAQLESRGLLPPLPGWRVIFSGLGDTAPPQPALPLPQRTALIGYWMAICHAAQAVSCGTDEMTRPAPPSHSTAAVPVVPVPAVLSVQGPRGWSGTSVPTDEFFAFASARLLPGADTILGPLAARVRSGHRFVSISGFASPDGGSAVYNVNLSERRSDAVKTELLRLGVPASHIVHAGGEGTAGQPPAACDRNGQLDENVCAKFRRVIILLSPAAAATS